MVRLLTLLLAVATCAFTQTRAVSFFTAPDSHQSASSSASMQRELIRILSAIDLRVSFHDSIAQSAHDANHVVVLSVRGSCDMSASAPPVRDRVALDSRGLASAPVSDGRVLPFVTVECDKLRHWLTSRVAGFGAEQRQELLGRAIARLVAHEFYHIFARTKHHASEGIGRSCFSLHNLLADRFDFDQVTVAQMRPLPSTAPSYVEDAGEAAEAAGR
jgi:hypothetical protein